MHEVQNFIIVTLRVLRTTIIENLRESAIFRVWILSDPESPRAKRAKDAKFGCLFLISFAIFASFARDNPNLWLRLSRARPFVVESKSQRAATLARIGAAEKSAGIGVDHNQVGAAKTLRTAADDLVAAANQLLLD